MVSALSLTAEPKKFLERMHAKLDDCLAALAQAVDEGRLHLPALQAANIDAEATRSGDAMFDIIGPIQFGDMLVQVDARSNFSEAFLNCRAKSVQELAAAYGALLAHGTEN